jgi:flagellar hook protein FlgE
MTVYDSLGTPVNVDVTMTLESSDSTGTKWRFYASSKDDTDTGAYTGIGDNGMVLNSGTIEFDNEGVYRTASNDVIRIARANTGASTPLPIKVDMSRLTSLTDNDQSVVPEMQDGFKTGTLSDFSIADNGDIVGEFTNGLTRTLGRVAIAHFDNPTGLIDQGGNNYNAGASSGEAVIASPGEFSAGVIRSGSLEQSNVDLSKEFIDMIVTTTGFSAASRVITTSNRLLDELLQTSR